MIKLKRRLMAIKLSMQFDGFYMNEVKGAIAEH
jgi:hypothetical protein